MDNKKLYIKGIKGKVNKLFLQPQRPGCKRRFFVPDEKKHEVFLRAQKNVLEQNTTK